MFGSRKHSKEEDIPESYEERSFRDLAAEFPHTQALYNPMFLRYEFITSANQVQLKIILNRNGLQEGIPLLFVTSAKDWSQLAGLESLRDAGVWDPSNGRLHYERLYGVRADTPLPYVVRGALIALETARVLAARERRAACDPPDGRNAASVRPVAALPAEAGERGGESHD